MSSDELLEQIQGIFQDVFDRPDLVVTRESNAQNVEDWDSLTHVNIILAIEHRYKVKFALGEVRSLNNVGELITALEREIARR